MFRTPAACTADRDGTMSGEARGARVGPDPEKTKKLSGSPLTIERMFGMLVFLPP
jgi:hypothetical protein